MNGFLAWSPVTCTWSGAGRAISPSCSPFCRGDLPCFHWASGRDQPVGAHRRRRAVVRGVVRSSLLSLDRLFAADYEDGTLDLLLLALAARARGAGPKCLSHWIAD